MSNSRVATRRRPDGRRRLRLVFTSGTRRDTPPDGLRADSRGRAGGASDLERAIHRRAVDAVLWGMPAVTYDLMRHTMVGGARGAFNLVAYWSRPPDWKIQTLTPNPDATYFTPFINTTKVGPVVLEIPPADDGSIIGTVMNIWQCALEDVGPGGADHGRGGRYVILPPGCTDTVPAGHFPVQSDTFEGYALLCSIPRSDSEADIARALAFGRRIRVYPLSQAATPPSTSFVDVAGIVPDDIVSADPRFFESLNRIVQAEPWLERDRTMVDQLRSIGIEKGRPFSPSQRMKELLNDAAHEADAWLVARYTASLSSRHFPGGHWALAGSRERLQGQATCVPKPDIYPSDVRGVRFSDIYFAPKHAGAGSSSLVTSADRGGRPLDGGAAYRLAVPADVPARQCWSATVHDRATQAPIGNARWFSRSSQTPGLRLNPDGTVDLYFGPTSPAGMESNWIPTSPDCWFEVLFRLYGPDTALFDKTWRLPDLEKIQAFGD